MKNLDRSKKQLVEELNRLRKRVSELEKSESEHKKAEELMRESEERFYGFSKASPYSFAIGDLTGSIVYGNSSFVDLIEVDNEKDVIGINFYDLVTKEGKNEFIETITPIVMKKGRYVGERALVTVKGRQVTTEQVIFLIYDEKGEPAYFANIITDITERKKEEERIKREKILSDSIVDNIPAGIAFLDNDFVLLKCNPSYAEFIRTYTPYTGEKALGMSYFDYASGSRPQVEEWFQKVRDTGQVETRYGFKLVLKQGGKEITTYWDSSVASVKDTNGKAQGILLLTQDMTKRMLTENKLRESEEKYRSLVESTEDSIYLVNINCEYLFINKKYKSRFSVPSEKIIGESYAEFHNKEETKIFKEKLNKVIKTGKSMTHEHHSLKDNKFFLRTYSSVKDSKGKINAVTVISKDISELRKAEEKTEKHEHELLILSKQLINAQEDERKRISQELHDEMGQALTMMKLNLSSIKDMFAPDQFSVIKNKWKELDSLTENMLEKTHQMTLDLRPHMMDDLGLVSTLHWFKNNFSEMLKIDVQFKTVNCEERFTPKLEITFYRIVQEAFTNIAKHAQAKNVLLEIKRLKSSVKLKIEDDGIGFNLEEVEKLRKKEHGVGLLGMKERASLFKGTCTVESVPGEGTRVEVKIPLR